MKREKIRPIPRLALVFGFITVLGTIAIVGSIQIKRGFKPPVEIVDVAPVETKALRFVDQGDGVNAFAGHVRVFDARTGAEFPELRPNDGFVRAVLNGLAFERSKRGLKGEPIFNLVLWANNRVTMEDPMTSKKVVLGAFGADNKSVFLRFLEHKDARS